MRKRTLNRSLGAYAALLSLILFAGGCLPKPTTETGGLNITLYGFSVMKESLEKAIYPGFVAKWKQEHGQQVHFTSSFAGSETVTNQIINGVPADIAILSIDRDAQRLKEKGFVTADWHTLPYKGIVNKTPFVIIVKGANPKGDPRLSGSRQARDQVNSSGSGELGRSAMVGPGDLRIGVDQVRETERRAGPGARAANAPGNLEECFRHAPICTRSQNPLFLATGHRMTAHEMSASLGDHRFHILHDAALHATDIGDDCAAFECGKHLLHERPHLRERRAKYNKISV